MATLPEPDKTYVCPRCGQKAVIGAHFCQPFAPSPSPVSTPPPRSPRASFRFLSIGVAGFLVLLVLWRWIGPGSLVLLALGLLTLLFFRQPRTGNGTQAKHAASSPGSELENKERSTTKRSDSKTPSSPPGSEGKSKR